MFLKRSMAALAACSLVLAACGSDDGSAETGGGSEVDDTSPDTAGPDTGESVDTEPEPAAEADPGAGGTDEMTTGGALVIGLDADPVTFDPAGGMATAAGRNVGLAMYETLVSANEDGSVSPNLAASMETADDGLTLTLTLPADVTFHDGTPVDADAVVANFDRLIDPATTGPCGAQVTGAGVTGISAVDATTVAFEFSSPSPTFAAVVLAEPCGFIASPSAIEASGDDYGQNPVGSGPFAFVSYSSGSELIVERFADYRVEGVPMLDEITYRFLPDQQTRFQSVQSGDIDLMMSLDASLVQQAEENGLAATVNLGLGSSEVSVNGREAPLDDPIVRRALSMALNREGFNTVLYDGAGMPSVAPVPGDSPYLQGADFAEYDLDGAKALLAEYGEPISLTLLSTEGRTQPAELAQQMWGQAGIDVTIEIVDQAQLIDRVLSNPDYQLAMWTGDEVANPSKMSLRYLSTGAVNTAGYANADVDAAFAEAASSADADRITELYQEIMGHVAADVPYLYLVRKIGVIVHTQDVLGVALAPVAGVQVVDPSTLSLAG